MIPSKVYRWKDGFHHKISASDAGEELHRLREEQGDDFSAQDVVEAARPTSSTLHPQIFDLAPGEAAEKYYLANASKMIRSVVYVDQRINREVREFSVVREQRGEGRLVKLYGSTEEALADPERRAYLLDGAKRELQSFVAKYDGLKELSAVIGAIRVMLETD